MATDALNAELEQLNITTICPLCKEPTKDTTDSYICRVCGSSFHFPCLETSEIYSPAELKLVERATTPMGWSCHDCDDLSTLLTPDEMERLSSKFEAMDMSRDAKITVDEFLSYKSKENQAIFGKPNSEDDNRVAKQQFQLLDTDGSGTIDYMEFKKNEAAVMLAHRDGEDLMKLLTPLELQSARRIFDYIDKDKGGSLEEWEIRHFFRNWYTNLDLFLHTDEHLKREQFRGMVKPKTEKKSTTRHINMSSLMMMEGDADRSGAIDWNEYLRNQAIYIISSRPNKVNLSQGRK